MTCTCMKWIEHDQVSSVVNSFGIPVGFLKKNRCHHKTIRRVQCSTSSGLLSTNLIIIYVGC